MNKKDKIVVLGAGPVGSLLSIFLKKKGFEIDVFEKRADVRKSANYAGKSINIALSQRGWTALEKVGLKDAINQMALPMYGRMIHNEDGTEDFQAYSSSGDAIYSVSRGDINKILIDEAEKVGVNFHFDQNCKRIDLKTNSLYFRNSENELTRIDDPKVCLAADGAFSVLRNELIKHENVNYSQEFLEHGYKELHLQANAKGEWQLQKNALHIWPRKSFMLIALPNLDGSFTCTLFLQAKGEISFENLKTSKGIEAFFETYFADIQALIPDLETQFLQNPVGSLVTIKCFPWSRIVRETHYCLLGDAAHAITPFYGQGMNCGFEDARIFYELIENETFTWSEVLNNFQAKRKPNADAIAQMAFDNFLEMRDGVTDPDYLAKKKLESEIKKLMPEWRNKYELVSFSDEPYSFIERFYKSYSLDFTSYLKGNIGLDELIPNVELKEKKA
ncbi:MAG: FAD-dependent oxidoreductase [Cytophagales bacterium]